ncbi:MAG: TetR/AcrR family transcriptional regulator, biofilm operon repressor [Acetobacterium sp.]|jgi:AcrR family transcriptional regulator|nr:TetR/AcrR family transcriptional regulator, biofilm operon repressor [Acetobacterium sp.]
MTTKEKIVDEALSLFSIYGFKATTVKAIADAVGIKDSSLYKHFSSKKEIFDTIVEEMREKMAQMSVEIGLPDENDLFKAASKYGNMSLEQLQTFSRMIFLFYLKDDFISRFWRLANMEQYSDPEIYEIYRNIFMEESIAYQTKLFNEMIRQGSFSAHNPEAMAMNFYAPIFFLLSKYNGRPEAEEEALEILDSQVEEFYYLYRKN